MAVTNQFGSNFLNPVTSATQIPGVVGGAGATGPIAGPPPTVNQGSLSGTMTTPTPQNTPPVYTPSQQGQSGSQQGQQGQPGSQDLTAPSSSPMALSQAMQAIQNNVANNNSLVAQKNLILKQLYDQPLSDADKTQLDPSLASTLASGDRNAIDFQLKLLNDQIAGRTNTLTQNVGYLTTGYNNAVQQAETAKQNAIQNVQNFVQQYGANAGAALAALYGPQYATQLAQMGINLQSFEQSSIPTVNQARYLGGAIGGVGEYDLTSYNPSNPNYPTTLSSTAQSYGVVNDAATAQSIINQFSLGRSPVTGDMVMAAAQQYGVDPNMIMSIMQNESHFNTDPKGTTDISTNNPGSIMGGPNGTQTQYASIQDGVNGIAQWLSRHATTGSTISATPPSGPTANVVNPSTGVTPNAIYAAAVQYAATGQMPSIGQGNSAAQVRNERQAIQNIGGAILAANGGSIAGNKAALTSNASALTKQTDYYNTIQRSINTVDQNIKLLQEAAQNVNQSSTPIVNQITNNIKLHTGDGALNAFKAAIQTVRSEYATILGRGQQTDQTRTESANLIPDNISADQLNQVISILQSEGQNVLNSAQQQVQTIQNNINNIVQPSSGASGASGAGGNDYQNYLSVINGK